MKHCTWALALLLMLGGCTFSRGIAYYKPSGTGNLAIDDRHMPTTMEYNFATGSTLAISIKRKRATADITFTVQLRDTARFASDPAGIFFFCDDRQLALPAPIWREQRIKDGVAYLADHAWADELQPGNEPASANKPIRGDHSTGEYRATMTLRDCKDLPFSFELPTVAAGGTVYEFGRVSLAPQMMPVTWTLPVPARVNDSLR